ncbi:tRNA lysidine(34) synthetase TilS [Halodesulfovibrio marinisediminis]|uniref:tRNA(Ile)-lysidine synthase n=1 Tax=Halodesulfovibrio marinisediminis DSM 17456 TaxID=1121457 RepID=A0A1N6DZU2_9BACT|nr:tRNA lysidine(34) synthetase TilS [Halodesulfovibrio marinisediminis]SIN76289.1 tRNA(Ile)-lysidine synthase [Halodesulfovibrio marinisediminis DSM 17456]
MNRHLPTKLQELNPKTAHICLGIENFITSKLKTPLKGSVLLVALSGGVDSSTLLIILSCLAQKNGCRIHAAHFNHQLRPEADAEEAHVRQLCESLHIELKVDSQDVTAFASRHKLGLEEAARMVRYKFLERERRALNADWIVTGHHANDLAEDVIMRLIRGTGWPALGGMEGKCNNRKILRPLLSTPKETLISFANACSLYWCEDASNEDENFLRNRVRSQVIPLLCKENPAFLNAITSLWELAQIDTDHWSALIKQYLENTDFNTPTLLKEDLESMSQATRLRVYKAVLSSMGKGQPLQQNLLALDAAWQANVGGKIVQFPGNKIATIRKGAIYFSYR